MKIARWLLAVPVAAALSFAPGAISAQDRHDRDRDRHERFDDHDKQVARDWYRTHDRDRDHVRGFRDADRHRDWDESRFREGYVIDRDMRRYAYAPPSVLVRGFAPPPRGWRYVVIGGHVVLVDNGWRVHDTIHFELNF
jgi:Ni/Co efflux regulator RcnB